MLSHARVWSAIDTLAAKHHLSASGLAKRAGLDPTAFNKSKRQSSDGRARWPSTESIAKILTATNSSVADFFEFANHENDAGMPGGSFPNQVGSIPLLGIAQAGAGGFFDDGGFPAGQGWDEVEFPASAKLKGSVYALEVQGESMMPLYRDGDILIVEPGSQLRRGDRVVLRTQEGEVMAKSLNRLTSRQVDLVSLNPEHPNRSFEMTEVDWIARIIWASQ